MSIITIQTLPELDQLCTTPNPFNAPSVHILMLNIDDQNIQQAGFSHAALVKHIRSHAHLKKVAVIFNTQMEQHAEHRTQQQNAHRTEHNLQQHHASTNA